MTRYCQECGKEFSIAESRSKWRRGKYCSRNCQYKGISKSKQVTNPNQIKCSCAVCGKQFMRYISCIQSNYQFCSRSCAYKGRSLGYVKRTITKPYNIIHSQKKRIEKICEICGNSFETIPSREKKNKYCSRKCFEISHKDRMKGENNPSYKDGCSYIKRSWRGHDWENIRKAIYARDGWACQLCGKHCNRKEIQCHHIEPYRINQNNDLANLMTLCSKCHGQIEATI